MDSTRLAHYRERAEAALPDVLGVVRLTRESDGALGSTEAWATIAVDVPCRVAEMGTGRSDYEGELGGMFRGDGTIMVRVPLGTDVTRKDRLVWNGRTLEVSRVMAASLGTLKPLACMEVT